MHQSRNSAYLPDITRDAQRRLRRFPRSRIALSVAVLSVVTSCAQESSSDLSSSPVSSAVDESMAETATTESTEPDTLYASTWIDVPAPEGCVCADGSPFSFPVREASPKKLTIVLSDGQFCFTGSQCNGIPRDWYDDTSFWQGTGMFDFANPDNPFAEHSVVFVPNCTLDGLVGNLVAEYIQAGQVHHTGHRNASSIIAWAANQFPTATEVNVVGLGLGGFAAPMMSGLVSELLPAAKVALIIDSHGATPDSFAGITSAWAFLQTFHPVPDFSMLSYETLTMTSTLELITSVFPRIKIARMNFAGDRVVRGDTDAIGYETFDMRQVLLEGEQRVEAAGNAIASWIAPGSAHLILDGPSLFELQFGEVRLVDWLKAFLNGDVVNDHVCTVCSHQ